MSSTATITKLLIANRGEIACRVMRTAQQLQINTVAVYSDADSKAMHVAMADEAVAIGPAPASQSYLDQDKIINAAKLCGANAIHPGYGFLSENATFARRCAEEGIIFVGPPASAIDAMGSKSRAKQIMQAANVPLVPGYHGDEQSADYLLAEAQKIGFPVMLKAAAGGGGKGMRQVMQQSEFRSALEAAKRESMASFGCDIMLVEKFLTQPRHVEIQVFCDTHGNGVYLFERDCSVQRRHQKIIEEAPAPGLSDSLRRQMGESAVAAAKAIDYVGAGTVEFLLDGDDFYFMEMNTRLQVEHPVTEMVTGEDLVAWQLRIASGQPLPKHQHELTCQGHAFEVRLYAEDPDNDFLPSTGQLKRLRFACGDHIRIDTGFNEGDTVSVHYDPMLAKLITWADNRELARQHMLYCLEQTRVTGVTTNIPFVHRVLQHDDFAAARLTTHFIPQHQQALQPKAFDKALLPVMAFCLYHAGQTAASPPLPPELNHWRMNHQRQQIIPLACNSSGVVLNVQHTGDALAVSHEQQHWQVSGHWQDEHLTITVDGHTRQYAVHPDNDGGWVLFAEGQAWPFSQQRPDFGTHEDSLDGACLAPMNGTVVKQLVAVNEAVTKGTALLVMEAMKMEHNIRAPADGHVADFFFDAGDMVDGGAVLLEFTHAEE
ncbi:acetyl/propionyl/methylcrotonyl-CoA carboxylase subunit alpha [Alteromonas gilva]|uniref:Acetyl/propionyl/methylcrotonyl-CoA carboxylase subunit alpha n=1 Tax=Alteromonas gilva TaxID=2987522 RepID=A0ABT5L484_9ALTE|nr:acetyl/propionyl/methylcrotonyl-CoA carboxylase subunit alpha [Alteromonas gilva]MDC8831311.1 acetyl/propionyl/methylcrotonyl-CoA carboxylase subunit alpha [Alteromonas gilva]